MENSIKPNQQFFTVLARRSGRKVFIFVWDFGHWLRFDSSIPDIMLLGTGKTRKEAEALAAEKLPGRKIVYKYCPKIFVW